MSDTGELWELTETCPVTGRTIYKRRDLSVPASGHYGTHHFDHSYEFEVRAPDGTRLMRAHGSDEGEYFVWVGLKFVEGSEGTKVELDEGHGGTGIFDVPEVPIPGALSASLSRL